MLTTSPAGLAPRAIVLSADTRLEIRVGRASPWRGAAIGAACGVLAGAMVGLSISDAVGGNAGDGLWVGGQLLPYTIPVGAVAGALLPFDRWAGVRIGAR